MKSFF